LEERRGGFGAGLDIVIAGKELELFSRTRAGNGPYLGERGVDSSGSLRGRLAFCLWFCREVSNERIAYSCGGTWNQI